MTALIFDMDGTLTLPRQGITKATIEALRDVKAGHKLHIVTGSNMDKVEQQIPVDVLLELFDNVGCCNGTSMFRTNLDPDREDAANEPLLIHSTRLLDHYSQADLNHINSTLLRIAAGSHTKYKTGTFVEWRGSQINFSIIGRNCSMEQREDYVEWDLKSGERERVVEELREAFQGWGLSFSLGGQISIDITRDGWDKSYALEFIDTPAADCVFFGDRIIPGGNDLEIAKACGKYYDVLGPAHLVGLLKKYS